MLEPVLLDIVSEVVLVRERFVGNRLEELWIYRKGKVDIAAWVCRSTKDT